MPHYSVDDMHEKIPAGWMIEQCGWKGRSLGRAGVHDRQALVLVNLGGATGQEIVDLCDAVRRDVFAKFHIDIHPEVNIV
jgi:UDP-N-acetylmuramate dehydrogenase